MAAQRSLFFFFFTRNWPWKSGKFWKIEKNRRSAIWPILLAALSTQGGFSKLLSAQGPPGPLPLETLIRIPPLHESRNSSKISRSQTVTSFRHFQGLTMVTLFLILWNFVSIRKNIVPIQIDVRISKTLLPRVHRTSLIDVLLHHTTTWHKAQRTGRSVQGLDLLDFSTGLNFFWEDAGTQSAWKIKTTMHPSHPSRGVWNRGLEEPKTPELFSSGRQPQSVLDAKYQSTKYRMDQFRV